jgi:hypothetical protein
MIGPALDTIAPTVTIVSPASNEVWSITTSPLISWTASDNVGVVSRDILFSADSGKTWNEVGTSIDHDSYAWVTPGTPFINALLRVKVHDAQGNSVTSDVRFCISGMPFFTSADSVTVRANEDFSYKVAYEIPGNPLRYKDTVLQKPDWLNVAGDVFYGKAPVKKGIDTVKVKITAGSLSATLVLVIHVEPTTMTLAGLLAKRDCFGIFRTGKGFCFGANAGAYEVVVYDLAGRVVFSRSAVAGENFVENLPMRSCNVYVVRLMQGLRSLTEKIQAF